MFERADVRCSAGRLGRMPRTDAEQVEALWGALLRDQASLSRFGRAETVSGVGHLIHLEAPDITEARALGLLETRSGAEHPESEP